MASEAGSIALAQRYQRIVVSAAVAALHMLIIYILAGSVLHSYGRLADTVIEADFILNDQPIPKPPALPPPIVQANSPVEFSPVRIDMDVPTEPVVATRAIDTGLSLTPSPPPGN